MDAVHLSLSLYLAYIRLVWGVLSATSMHCQHYINNYTNNVARCTQADTCIDAIAKHGLPTGVTELCLNCNFDFYHIILCMTNDH